jgi:prevent-host-death family protein
MTMNYNIHEIKAQFSKFIEIVEGGETVVVCKRNVPVAEIRPIEKKKDKRIPILGSAEGMGKIARDFDEMPEDAIALWNGLSDDDPLQEFAVKKRK